MDGNLQWLGYLSSTSMSMSISKLHLQIDMIMKLLCVFGNEISFILASFVIVLHLLISI